MDQLDENDKKSYVVTSVQSLNTKLSELFDNYSLLHNG
jgi:hypothetical protein